MALYRSIDRECRGGKSSSVKCAQRLFKNKNDVGLAVINEVSVNVRAERKIINI